MKRILLIMLFVGGFSSLRGEISRDHVKIIGSAGVCLLTACTTGYCWYKASQIKKSGDWLEFAKKVRVYEFLGDVCLLVSLASGGYCIYKIVNISGEDPSGSMDKESEKEISDFKKNLLEDYNDFKRLGAVNGCPDGNGGTRPAHNVVVDKIEDFVKKYGFSKDISADLKQAVLDRWTNVCKEKKIHFDKGRGWWWQVHLLELEKSIKKDLKK